MARDPDPAAATRPGLLKLGLIGDNIAASRAPRLHHLAGRLAGRDVRYDRLVPADMGLSFDQVWAWAEAEGYRGLNITYPYKERAAAKVDIADPLVAAMGAVNTVLFQPGAPPRGFNTDHSGFIRAYRAARGAAPPGAICLIGAGGAGKAVGFALLALGARAIRCVDLDPDRAAGLARALRAQGRDCTVESGTDAVGAARGAEGLINCTPLGMEGIGGTPLPVAAMAGAAWAFDAVYTPEKTTFLQDARRAGLATLSGVELFFGQGVDAWALFSDQPVSPAALRAALAEDRP
jgi:shikimate dehydrogenase